jgi:hypothetical protein
MVSSRRPLKYDPVRRMTESVLSQGFPAGVWPDSELAKLAGDDNLGWWIGHLREAEASIRRHRKRLEALRDGAAARACPGCGGPVAGRADAVYCGSVCRGRAHRERSQARAGKLRGSRRPA